MLQIGKCRFNPSSDCNIVRLEVFQNFRAVANYVQVYLGYRFTYAGQDVRDDPASRPDHWAVLNVKIATHHHQIWPFMIRRRHDRDIVSTYVDGIAKNSNGRWVLREVSVILGIGIADRSCHVAKAYPSLLLGDFGSRFANNFFALSTGFFERHSSTNALRPDAVRITDQSKIRRGTPNGSH